MSNEMAIEDIPKKVLEICESGSNFEAFVNLVALLQQTPTSADLLINILVEKFATIDNDQIPMASPLLIDTISKNKNIISFENFYQILYRNGKDKEIWRFIKYFELSPAMLPCRKQCKLSEPQIATILQSYTLNNAEISDIIFDYPNLAPVVYKAIGDQAAPFIISQINRISKESIALLIRLVQGSNTLLEAICGERLNIPLPEISNRFLDLERHKRANRWAEAASVAASLGMESEYQQCISHLDNNSLIHSNTPNSIMRFECGEALKSLSLSLETSDESTFNDFSNRAALIASRIKNEMENSRRKRENAAAMLDDLISRQTKSPKKPSSGDKCCDCGRRLGRGEVAVFPCGHVFHPECLKEAQAPGSEDCPVCGLGSASSVHRSLCRQPSQGPDFWSLKI